uniref:androgen-induced gene 1 protein-like n=1 Tax=Myxine glutinosa TaxID=7769 RepID=UPI00358E1CCE
MAGRALCAAVHCAVVSWYIVSLIENESVALKNVVLGRSTYGGKWKFLTFLDMILQTAYFCVALVVDILGQDHDGQRNAAPKGVQKLRNYMFGILAFPVGLFVVLTFWMIYAFDRELIYPTYLDLVIPVWLNHAMHTTVMPFLLLEMTMIPHVYPRRGVGIAGVISFGICYLIWTLWIRYAGGFWVYPILAWLAGPGLVVFILVGGLALTGLYVLGEVMNARLWPGLEGNRDSVARHKNK